MKDGKWLISIVAVVLIGMIFILLKCFCLIPQKSYSNADFHIVTYQSQVDKDQDGVDDQTDILNSAREYVKTKPKYKSKYYSSGYPDDSYGVCTDVVGFALLNSGYDMQALLQDDIKANKDHYPIEIPDKNIDFRRVRNLKVFLDHHVISLTTDMNQIHEWQGGDIVTFTDHIAIVSDKRNKDGITYLIHNAGQPIYEEDAIQQFEITGHYRFYLDTN